MPKENRTTQEMGIFGKYLTLWIGLCIIAGVLIGKFLPVNYQIKPEKIIK